MNGKKNIFLLFTFLLNNIDCWCWVVFIALRLKHFCFRLFCLLLRCTVPLAFLFTPTFDFPQLHCVPSMQALSPTHRLLHRISSWTPISACLSFHSGPFCGPSSCLLWLYHIFLSPNLPPPLVPHLHTHPPPFSSPPVSLPAQPSLWIIFNELLYSGRQISAPTHHWAQGCRDALCISISSEPPLCY